MVRPIVSSLPVLVTLSAAFIIEAEDTVDLLQTAGGSDVYSGGWPALVQDDPQLESFSPNHDACTPSCKWSCESAKCAEVCEPECRPPVCETRCEGANISGCVMECDEPHCAVHCPAHMCPNGGCPSCGTTCSEPMCKLKCDNSQPCKNVCEKPDCHWNCKAPEHCPAPVCNMVCESPADCQGKTYEALPPLEAGQMAVRSFSVTGDTQDPSAAIVNGQPMPQQRHAEYHVDHHAEYHSEPEVAPVEARTGTPVPSDSENQDSLESILGKDLFSAVSDLTAPLPSNFDLNATLGFGAPGSPFGHVASHDSSNPVEHAVAQPLALGITGDKTLDDFLNGADAPGLFRRNLRASSQPPPTALTQVPVHFRTANADGSTSYAQQVLPVVPSRSYAALR